MNQGFTLTSSTTLFSLAENHSFSAKERDTETGLSYFGARYYSSDLSIWLSVDPMSDKYPSLSPYVYCADNPVRLVDPNGDSVVFKLGIGYKDGHIDEAVKDLQNAAPNLNLTRCGNNLVIGKGGMAKTKYEKLLEEAIKSTEFKSVITLESLPNGQGGSYFGTNLIDHQYVSENSVDILNMRKLETESKSVRGSGLMHEITEGLEMGKIAKGNGLTSIEEAWRIPGQTTAGVGETEKIFPDDRTGQQYQLYDQGHRSATPQPGHWYAREKNFFKE